MPYVVALKPSHAWWAPAEAIGAVWEVAAAGGWVSPEQPGAWVPVERHFRDGHTTTWWALEGVAGPYGPERARRLVIATPDPATLAGDGDVVSGDDAAAGRRPTSAEVVRLYGLRNWVEQQYKQVKTSLGWSQYQVRSDRAMRRHWALVQCAFAFCWWAETRAPDPRRRPGREPDAAGGPPGERGEKAARRRIRPGPGPGAAGRVALRRVRAWLEPAWFLWRCWRAWTRPAPATRRSRRCWTGSHQGHPAHPL